MLWTRMLQLEHIGNLYDEMLKDMRDEESFALEHLDSYSYEEL
jgi:hypothetical protein